ncbi:MAG TPA: hypothetical protein VMF29_08360, partial [Candidatus Edwardsbacteria bacterium]|nr:hypothetical protein [Candidatus Edwardsbacteria bacterium]
MKRFSLLVVTLLAAAPLLLAGTMELWNTGHHPVPIPRSFGGKNADSVWFTVGGSATHVHTIAQGQAGYWAVNCLPHDTIQWEMWIDTDRDGVFDTTGAGKDYQLFVYSCANGDTAFDKGLPDTSAALDSVEVNGFKVGLAPGLYWYKATSLVTGHTACDSLRVTALPSPWATVSGHVHVPGDSALQRNLWVEGGLANSGDHSMIFWAGLTDSAGGYTISFDNTYPDSAWKIGNLRDLTSGGNGYVAPGDSTLTVTAGAHSGVNFSYQAASDSITGDVTIYPSGTPPFAISGGARKQNGGRDKSMVIDGYHYQVFFTASDTGEWMVGVRPTGTVTAFMQPSDAGHLYPVGAGHLVRNFVYYPADDSIKGRVTEQGGAPTRTYELYSSSNSLNANAAALTDAQGYYTLRVSSLDSSYNVQVESNDSSYPIPTGWTVTPGNYPSVKPPAAGINFNVAPATEFINGRVTQDTGDAQAINYTKMRVMAYHPNGGGGSDAAPDSAGNYSIPVYPDTFQVQAECDRFLFKPGQYQNVAVQSHDTIRGKDFIANYGNCRVAVTLSGFPSGDTTSNWLQISDSAGWPNGYEAGAKADSAGTYSLYICEGRGWRIGPPRPSGWLVDSSQITLGTITHADTLRQVTFHYSRVTSGIAGHITQDAGDAQAIDKRWVSVMANGVNSGWNPYSTSADSTGDYVVLAPPDTYNVTAGVDMDQHRFLLRRTGTGSVVVQAGDTTTGVDLLANYCNCHVKVTLVGYPSDTAGHRLEVRDATGYPDGYINGAQCHAAGTYDLWICNGGGWNVAPPRPDGWMVDSAYIQLGTITHADTLRQVTFHYSQLSSGISGTMTQDPGDAQA